MTAKRPARGGTVAADPALLELQTAFSAALHNTGRSWSQAAWLTIAMVAKAASAPSQKQLADLLGVEGPTVVAMVDRLVASSYVERIASPIDRRVKLIALTAEGHALYAKVKSRADVFRAELLAGFDADALRAATSLLEQVQARIEAQIDEAQ